ncbi:uracil-DNA glycosylase family protein [Marinobacter sp. X15-166B]|uniref:uracil-DNA glycosylase family protein n=1 Tax=Marinobacter sp. X15-166B TaxID=1897620 RepID=UPI000A6C326C|nr:uracil-DNA glycosylase family protein [Marinobacter sp. X15-166B]
MESLDRLLARVRQCTLCEPELPCGARPVLQMDTRARILVAGQAPGRRVHDTGIPFNDPSGVRLRAWMGVTPEVFYDPQRIAIIPMGLCYPGKGRGGDLPPRAECAPAWRATLLQQLPELQLVLAIGQYAQAYHLPGPRRAVTDNVRNWRDHWPAVLPLPHPSGRNNIWLHRHPWFAAEVLPVLQTRIAALLGPDGRGE